MEKMLNDKRGFVDWEVIMTPAFFILVAVGYVAFFIMLLTLGKMESGNLLSWWVKTITIVAIPIVAYVFTLYSGN